MRLEAAAAAGEVLALAFSGDLCKELLKLDSNSSCEVKNVKNGNFNSMLIWEWNSLSGNRFDAFSFVHKKHLFLSSS